MDVADETISTMEKWNRQVDLAGLLMRLGEDLGREGLQDTPRRVRKAWEELLSGYTMDPQSIAERVFTRDGQGIQICRGIFFTSLCEHHMLPFLGYVDIGYEANEYVIGLSKLPRLVDCYAKRLQLQERLSADIASALYDEEFIDAKQVIVRMSAVHLCSVARGVKQAGMSFETVSTRGDITRELAQPFFSIPQREVRL